MKAPQFPDHTQNAVAFTHHRALLASLMVMTALQALLFVTKNHRMDSKNSKMVNFCSLQCHLSFTAAILLSAWTFVLAISTETALYRGDFNPHYQSLFGMLMGEFKFEFTLVRWCSLLSIISILRGIILHFLLNYELIHKERLTHALIVISASMAEIFYLISYINSTLHSSNDLWNMTGSIFKMIWERIDFHQQPLVMLSFFATGVLFGLLMKNCFSNFRVHQLIHVSKQEHGMEKRKAEKQTKQQ